MSELQNVIDTLDHAADAFDGIATAEQKKIYSEVLTLAKNLDTDAQGKVKQSVANLKRLTQIKAKLAALSKDKEWVAGITQFAQYFGILQQQQNVYYTAHFPSLTLSTAAKQKHQLMKQLAVQNTMDALMGSGLKANVTDKLNDILLRAVTTNAKFSDLQEELRAHLLGKDGGQGAFARYATTYATTALSQFTGQNNKLLTDDLDCEWFMYVGSNKETTREFCSHLTAKKFVHRSEIPDLLKGKIDDYQCAIYPKTNLPYGMIEGTTPDNFQCNCGGWNCRHQLIPVADAVVPANLRAKFSQKNTMPVQKTDAVAKKPIDLTPYKDQISIIEQYIADHPKSAKIKGYLSDVLETANNGNETDLHAILLAAKKDIAKFNAAKNAVAKKKSETIEAKIKKNDNLDKLLKFIKDNDTYKLYDSIKYALDKGNIERATRYINRYLDLLFDKATLSKAGIPQKVDMKYVGGDVKMTSTKDTILPDITAKQISELTKKYKSDAETEIDSRLRNDSTNQWATLTKEERLVITKYTETYSYLNERLRNLEYLGSRPFEEYERDVVVLTNALEKCRTTQDMIVRRGTDDYWIRELKKKLSEVKVGDKFTDGAFLSTAVHRKKGMFKEINLIIYIPKGSMGFYVEPASHYNDDCKAYYYDGKDYDDLNIEIWNGSDKQTIGIEMEWLGQRGCRFEVIKKVGKNIHLKLIGQLYKQP